MGTKLHTIFHYFRHWLLASNNGHGVHSPFAYALCEEVFYNKDGSFVYSLKYFNGDQLPVNIIMELNKKFEASKIAGVTELTTQSNTLYNIKLIKGDKLYCLDVLTDGTIAKQEEFTNNTAN